MKQIALLLNNRKMAIGFAVAMLLGVTLIFSQYFGAFPLSDEYALDMLMYYSKERFFDTLNLLDSVSRTSYLMIHLADYIFMFGFYQLIALGLYKLTVTLDKLKPIVLIPYLAFLGDFLENIIMDLHLLIYPSQINLLGYLAGVVTFVKFSSMYLALALLIVLTFYRLIQGMMKQRNSSR